MPNIKSAKKRVLVLARRKEENRSVKSAMATKIKNFKYAVASNEIEKAEGMLRDIISNIDSAQSKGVIHKKNASRKISRLNCLLNKVKKEPIVIAKPKAKVVDKEAKAEEKSEAKTEELSTIEDKTPKAKKETVKKETKTVKKSTPKKTATKKEAK